MLKLILTVSLFTELVLVSCKRIPNKNSEVAKEASITAVVVYETENLQVIKLSNHIYEHVSFLNTDNYGKVACNGMFVVNENVGVLFDTPTDNESALELINFITKKLKSKVIAVIPTHFHEDCIGGIEVFEKNTIPVYALRKTVALLKENNVKPKKQIKEFENHLMLNIGDKKVYAKYFGEGHTIDNSIGYFPEDNAIFGGCLLKSVGAGKGYLGDANTNEWSATVQKIKQEYPKVKIVIPGHGKWGGAELFDYTIALFK